MNRIATLTGGILRMALKDTFKELKELLLHITTDLEKSEKGNKAASQRVRTGTVKLEKVAKKYRKESISFEKKNKSPKKAPAKKAAKPKAVAKPKAAAKPKAKAVVKAKPKMKAVKATPARAKTVTMKRATAKLPSRRAGR